MGSYLRLQINTGERHLSHLVEANGQRDGAKHKERVIDGNSHQDNGLDLGGSYFDQQGTGQVHHQEKETDTQKDQVEWEPMGRNRKRGESKNSCWLVRNDLGDFQKKDC